MQGRLLPRFRNRYQSHPLNYWQAEFFIARDLSFDRIEFILDYNDYEQNPLMSVAGIEQIKSIISESGVEVKSVCADYFMEAPFHSTHQAKSEDVFMRLIENAKELGVIDIVVPCVDHSSLKTSEDFDMFVSSINKALPLAHNAGVFINFETDLAPKPFLSLLQRFESSNIKVNYDSGNSAAIGYDLEEEFDTYGGFISDLHIKDRVLGGGSVMLGTGNAEFDKLFRKLKGINFNGVITMQASRDDDYIKDLQRIKIQKEFLQSYIDKYLK